MKRLNTLLFDLDGTLIDTNEIIIKSYQHAFKTFLPDLVLPRSEIIRQIGPPLKNIFASYVSDSDTVDAMIETYRDYYVTHEGQYHRVYPEVKDVIAELHSQGYNLGIVTSKFKVAAWPSFTHYGLDKYFSVFVALEDVKNPKPHEEPVLKALSGFKNVDRAIMIGDNQGDILSGKNAGILAAGVAWSIKGAAHLQTVAPDYMLHSMRDLFAIIKKIDEEG